MISTMHPVNYIPLNTHFGVDRWASNPFPLTPFYYLSISISGMPERSGFVLKGINFNVFMSIPGRSVCTCRDVNHVFLREVGLKQGGSVSR